MQSRFQRWGGVLAAITLLSAVSDELSAKTNFVFFIADDVSPEDLGCYGHPHIQTPNIDALAAGGLRFTQAYLTTSSCSPSRCSILTGRYPHNTGAPELHTSLPDSQIRFPELLREAGYYTVLSGKNHMVGSKEDRAFDHITSGGGPGKEEDWVEHVEKRPTEKPFFFWFASSDAHRTWSVSQDLPTYTTDQVVVPPFLIDDEATREDLALYYHEITRFDHFIGKVVEELKEQGVFEQTLIFVMADNGRPFPRSKTLLYDSGIRTPFVISYPEGIQQPAVTDRLVSALDVSATILEAAGISDRPTIQGLPLQPLFTDPTATVREVVFAEHNWHVHKNHERMVRWGDWLYIKNNYPDQANLCVEAYKFPAGESLWKAHAEGRTNEQQQQIFANPSPEEQLFRVSKDPHQLTNLASLPEVAPQLKVAREALRVWTEETGDTIPANPTGDRDLPPRIVNGEVLPGKGKAVPGWTHGEMAGDATNAGEMLAKGPAKLP
ncbi:MAG: sulfatase [Verrucomicrobiota bacterium]